MSRFEGKRILIGLCGGIAAYKACDIIRQLYREGAETVQIVMTKSAQAFVTPLTLETLSQNPVLTESLENTTDGVPIHIALAQDFDVFLILPATANTVAKLAHGMADDLLSTTAITFTNEPILLAPAMNGRMWANPIFQENLEKFVALPWVDVVPPEWGALACGETSEGKLAQQETILAYLYRMLSTPHYLNQKIVVTAGGTAEPIDAVRYMTNRSSGKMGLTLADEAWAMGADVTLIHTIPELPARPYETQFVRTVEEMANATHQAFEAANALFMTAAVSDFKALHPETQKIKKQETLEIALEKTRDILTELGERKRTGQLLIGFAAESQVNKAVLQDKLQRKNLDFLACNDISRADIGFGASHNEIHLLTASGEELHLPKAEKTMIARELLRRVATSFSEQANKQQLAAATTH